MKIAPARYWFGSSAALIRCGVVGITCLLSAEAQAQDQAVRQAREEMYHDLTNRRAELSSTLERLDQTTFDIEQWLATRGIAPADLAAQLEEVTDERAQLVAIVAETEQRTNEQLHRLQTDPEMLETVFASNALELARLQEEIEQLHRELREVPRDVGLQTSVSLAGLSARPFLLTGDRIAPFGEPYFSSREIRVRLADRSIQVRRRFDRESDAGLIQTSIEPGGVVADLIDASDFDPTQTYVTLWVCADAIEGYRFVSEFLKSRGVRYTWTTDVDEPWVASPESPEYEAWGYEAK
ncbi:MAG: hypothetical protein HOH58_17670 [Opitutaceae bacterium]|nr:hypothetical protein [Opitutaceae bacterium]